MSNTTPPPDSGELPATYRHWQDCARRLIEPLAALMHPDRADIDLAGPPSDHDRQADRLESCARPLALAAFWLRSMPRPEDTVLRGRVAGWFRTALVLGTDPASPHYWGPDASYHQHHVEMGLMAIALQLAPRDLWEPLSPAGRAQVLAWFGTSRGSGIVNNNHLFMSVHILEFLGQQGAAHRTDRAVVEAHLNQLETMHRGGGWFEDGINQAFDHYNAYAFHFYGLMWSHLHGARDPVRAGRWREWARAFVADYQHFFAASGEHPAFGRSISYRFNALNVFGLALLEGCTDAPPGGLRRLCTRSLDFFLSRPICTAQGALGPGFTDVFPRIIETYSAPASPYWAAKGFTPLLLPPSHPFWTDPEQPMPAERGFVRLIAAPGIVVRSLPDGEVELLNGGSMVGNTQLRYGPWKWSKMSYRTGTHFTFSFPEISGFSPDGALTQQIDDGRVFGRHSTVVVEMSPLHLGYAYNLGAKAGQVNTSVETFVFWKDGWLLHVHNVAPRQPVVLRVGGFALPLSTAEVAREGLAAFAPDGRGTVLQPLLGSFDPEWDLRLDDAVERRHVSAPYHATPVLCSGRLPAGTILALAALSWAGSGRASAAPWRVMGGDAKSWHLEHPSAGNWHITHWALPALA